MQIRMFENRIHKGGNSVEDSSSKYYRKRCTLDILQRRRKFV